MGKRKEGASNQGGNSTESVLVFCVLITFSGAGNVAEPHTGLRVKRELWFTGKAR